MCKENTLNSYAKCTHKLKITLNFNDSIWLVGWFGLSGPLRQYFSLYRTVSKREGERGEKGQMRVKMSKQPPTAPTASETGPCPTVIQIVGRPGTGSLPSTIAPPDHPFNDSKLLDYHPFKHINIFEIPLFIYQFVSFIWGWSGCAMVLCKPPVPGRPTIWMLVGQGPFALAVGAGGGCLDIFTLLYLISPLSPPLWETVRYRLKYCLKGPLNPKRPTN